MENFNYYETFITVASDCPATQGEVPPIRKSGPTKPSLEFELLSNHPYTFTQEDLIYEVYVRHKEIPDDFLMKNKTVIRNDLFKKPQPCLRASMLPKKYGWGLHFDKEGKIALYGIETKEYQTFIQNMNGMTKLLPAMRNSRKK